LDRGLNYLDVVVAAPLEESNPGFERSGSRLSPTELALQPLLEGLCLLLKICVCLFCLSFILPILLVLLQQLPKRVG
jgi:hypothetical protein